MAAVAPAAATMIEAGGAAKPLRAFMPKENIGLLPSQKVPMDPNGALPMPEHPTQSAVRLYPSPHRVSMTRYATSTDPRGYLPVYEYTIPGACNPQQAHTIMIDCENGYVLFTTIWKALGHIKADVVKLIDSAPEISAQIKKIRGGYLKIQGTWLPFNTARTLARRVAYHLRRDLIPIFGPSFPDECLQPGQPGFGQLLLSQPKQRTTSGRRPRSDRKQQHEGQPDTHGREAPPSAYYDSPAVLRYGQQSPDVASHRRLVSSSGRYHPYNPRTPSLTATPAGTSLIAPAPPVQQQQRHYLHYMQAATGNYIMLAPPNGSSSLHPSSANWCFAHPQATMWRKGGEVARLAAPSSQQSGDVGTEIKVARQYTSSSDQEAISSLMSMAGSSGGPSLIPTSQSISFPSIHSIVPSSTSAHPRACATGDRVAASQGGTRMTNVAPISETTWSPGLLASPGHYLLKHAHESNIRSNSAEPAFDQDGAMDEEVQRSSSAPPLMRPSSHSVCVAPEKAAAQPQNQGDGASCPKARKYPELGVLST